MCKKLGIVAVIFVYCVGHQVCAHEGQQQREHERFYQQVLPNWHACNEGEFAACDRALASPMLVPGDRQRLIDARTAILDRQRQEARIRAENKPYDRDFDLERLRETAQVESLERERKRRRDVAESLRRQQEQQRPAEIQAESAAYDGCHSYDPAACNAALPSVNAGAHDRPQVLAWRATAQDFEDSRTACQKGSVSDCDLALASPLANDLAREALANWRAVASPMHQIPVNVTETGSIEVSTGQSPPVFTLVAAAIAAVLGFAFSVHRFMRFARHGYVHCMARLRRPTQPAMGEMT